jgi:hypothetical protein
VLAAQPPAERQLTEGTLAGLRFVRNWMGHHLDPGDFIRPAESAPGADDGSITAWRWKPVPEPGLTCLPPRGQAWELTRYWAYEAELAGHLIGEPFGLAAAFLRQAAAQASLVTEASADPPRGVSSSRVWIPVPGSAAYRADKDPVRLADRRSRSR